MKALRYSLICWALLAGCGDDDDSPNTPSPDGGTAIDASVVGSLDSGVAADSATPAPSAESRYLVATSVDTADESNLLMMVANKLDNASLDPSKALQFPGGGNVAVYGGKYYVVKSEGDTITRYTYDNGAFKQDGDQISFLNEGIEFIAGYFEIHNATRAYLISGSLLKIFEWNPTTMTRGPVYDISSLKKEGWGHEFRGAFERSDGKLFLQWAYTNDRKDFINDFTVAVFDTKTNTISKVITDTVCPTSAAFGGYFDESEDLYLIADNFGLFTKFGGFPNQKEACILRIKKGSDELDASFRLVPKQALGGLEPWGLYYAGNGIAYTTAVDPAKINQYASVFELIFAPIHKGFLIDTTKNTSSEVKNIPLTGVGFASFTVDGQLLVPRTTGTVKVFDVEASQSTIYSVKADATATPLFALPGTLSRIVRIR